LRKSLFEPFYWTLLAKIKASDYCAVFFIGFFWALSCSPSAAAHPKLAAAEGEQGRNDESATICPLFYGELCTSWREPLAL